jgi:glutaconyl-CoA/methylmalonyl-CoA decarboxylase subunit gamma
MRNLRVTVNGTVYDVQVEEVGSTAVPAAPAAASAPAPAAQEKPAAAAAPAPRRTGSAKEG